MQLSKRCAYALRALSHIAQTQTVGGVGTVRDIAKREQISPLFLEQVLLQLKDAGILTSRRGRGGGFQLARPAAKLSIGEVVRLIDGPLAPLRCASVSAYERCSCPDEESCTLRKLMREVRDATATVLDQTSLADLIESPSRCPVKLESTEVGSSI